LPARSRSVARFSSSLERGADRAEGDGSIPMALGCLTTIGMVEACATSPSSSWTTASIRSLAKQKAATAVTADVVAIARGAGIADSHWVRDAAHFETLMSRRFDEGGPLLLAAKIDDQGGTAQTPRDPALIRQRFMRGLGTGRQSALDA
jgi:hypothetical protein